MLPFEKKLITFLSKHILLIGAAFIVLTAIVTRGFAQNYVGLDFHYYLYDMPGNGNSFLYRTVTAFLLSRTDRIVAVLKWLSYFGDACVAVLAWNLWGNASKEETFEAKITLKNLFLLAAVLLSPTVLLYSVGGMRPDSVCMALILTGFLFGQKAKEAPLWVLPAILFPIAAAFWYPVYWPVCLVLCFFMLRLFCDKGAHRSLRIFAWILILSGLILAAVLEHNPAGSAHFFGQIFVIDRATGMPYAGIFPWIRDMLVLYGYVLGTGTLFFAFADRRWRVPALVVNMCTAALFGWLQTAPLIPVP